MKSVHAILIALCVAAMLSAGGSAAAQYTQPPAMPAAQVPPAQVPETWLMLKNGSTFSARMLSAGERVRLRVNEGDIEVRASEIALTGYSLSDLAEQQWASLHQQQLDKQLPFIDWCARHHLYDIADTALAQMAANTQDPPRVAGYQTRVKRLREIHQEQLAFQASQTAATPPVASSPAAAAVATPQMLPPVVAAPTPIASAPTLLLPAQPLAPTPSSSVLPTAATLPVPSTPGAAVPSSVQHAAAHQPLENPRATTPAAKEPTLNSPHPATLPSAAVELFTARVQPWVVSRCSGCHDQQSPHSFKLERYSKQEGVTRATTLKNLAATTRLVDKDNPAESPLLVMASRAHGTSLMPPITAGDAAAMAAFRDFVGLATGRELPKPAKPSPNSAAAPTDQTGHVTPGRATFPASAVEEPATEDKAAALLKQTGPGWQAAIERQKAIDAEAQKLRDLQNTSQQVNAARGLISDPAVQPAITTTQSATTDVQPAATTSPQPAAAPPTTLPLPPTMLVPATTAATQSAPTLLLETAPPVASLLTTPPTTSLPAATAPVVTPAPAVTPSSVPQINTLPPSSMPESLLPKSLAAKPKPAEANTSDEVKPASTTLNPAEVAPTKPVPPINLNRPRRQFPLPPEDKPASKGVGTGEIKRR